MTPDESGLDLGRLLRALRRSSDLSQRELATRVGISQSALARIESGAVANPSFRTVERLVRAAGAELSAGHLHPVPHEDLRDAADRRYPAHLDIEEVTSPERWWGAWWTTSMARSVWPLHLVPSVTYDLSRAERDRRRERAARGRLAVIRQGIWDAGRGSAAEAVEAATPADRCIFVAELADGTRVGELRAHRGDPAEAPVPSWPPGAVVLDGVVVAADWRRLGIGRRLLLTLRNAVDAPIVALAAGWLGEQFLRACGYQIMSGRSARWHGLPGRAGPD